MTDRRRVAVDAALYGASALAAAAASAWASIPLYRQWGREALIPYTAAAAAAGVVAVASAGLGAWAPRVRLWLAVAVLFGAGLAPMLLQVAERAETFPGLHAQSEVIVTEEAASALLDGRNPYAVSYAEGPLVARPPGVQEHFPYMPAMLVFGLPRALDGTSPLADARVWLVAAALGVGGAALALSRADAERRLRAFQVLAVLPTGAAFMAGGAHVLPVLALMLLSLVLLDRRCWAAAGVALGASAAMLQLAWVLLPFSLAAAGDRRSRVSLGAGWLAAVMVVVPFLAWGPRAFVEDAIRYPLGVGAQPSTAEAPTLGRLLVDALPSARGAIAVAVVVVLVAWTAMRLARAAPRSAGAAAKEAGLLLALAVLLAASGRLGYWVFPADLLVWAWVLSGDAYPQRPEPAAESAAGKKSYGSESSGTPGESWVQS